MVDPFETNILNFAKAGFSTSPGEKFVGDCPKPWRRCTQLDPKLMVSALLSRNGPNKKNTLDGFLKS